ncbi:hypothetical protein D3C80_695360 [compost metagenome]
MAEQPGGLDLRVDTDVVAGALVEPLDHLYLFLEGVDLEVGLPQREAGRIDGHLLALHQLEGLRHAQGAHLGQGEVHHIVTTVRTGAAGEARRHVRDAVEEVIVHHHQLVIPGHHQILLQIVGPHAIGQRLGLQGVLGQIAGGATVGDHYLAVIGGQGGQCEGNPEAKGHQGEVRLFHKNGSLLLFIGCR